MPLIDRTDYQPPFWLPNGHLQSIYPSLFRHVNGVNYERERIRTDDDDFLDLDWSFSETNNTAKSTSLVILSHGLEGNTSSQYMLGMVRLMVQSGFDCLSWNFRGCSGEMNEASRFYHSGATEDLEAVVQHSLSNGYKKIHLVGFSLGGNLTLKYLGEQGAKTNTALRSAVVFSVPMDLRACSLEIIKPRNKIYMHRFLKSLKPKLVAKSAKFPDLINMDDYRFVRTLYDFDHIYTSSIHGFNGADDYYAQCSAMHFVETTAIPTLIVNAMNDPMVPYESLPLKIIAGLKNVWLQSSSQGGHCGFRQASISDGVYWSEKRALQFINENR